MEYTYKYSKTSKHLLAKADPRLQKVFEAALYLGLIDISIIETHRNKSMQDRYFSIGKSQVMWPNSQHNCSPSLAVDAVPYVNGAASYNLKHCTFLAGIICSMGKLAGVGIRWGGNWDQDGEVITDQNFNDLAHYELIGD